MASKNLGRVLMCIGALDDLAEIVKKGKGVNYETLPERIKGCTDEIVKCLRLEHDNTIESVGSEIETFYGLSKKLLKDPNY